MDGYEIVQPAPELIYRKIFEDRKENNEKNEYHYFKNGKLTGPFVDIKSAVEAFKLDK